MNIVWHPIETHPKDRPVLCAEFDENGECDLIGVFRYDTTDWQQRRWPKGQIGMWLQTGGTGCDGCWRDKHDFTHWAEVPVLEKEEKT